MRAMSVNPDCPSTGRDNDLPLEGCTDESSVLAWVSEGDDPKPRGDGPGCPTCGFAGEFIVGPDATACPACLAEYPKVQGWKQIVHCPNCNLAIGILKEDLGKTTICTRCKYFLGGIPKAGRPTSGELTLTWVKAVPAWAWLILAGWNLYKVVGTIVTPPALTRLLPYVGIVGFLVLACCRVWLWRTTVHKGG
jgi:hypothetical protein